MTSQEKWHHSAFNIQPKLGWKCLFSCDTFPFNFFWSLSMRKSETSKATLQVSDKNFHLYIKVVTRFELCWSQQDTISHHINIPFWRDIYVTSTYEFKSSKVYLCYIQWKASSKISIIYFLHTYQVYYPSFVYFSHIYMSVCI